MNNIPQLCHSLFELAFMICSGPIRHLWQNCSDMRYLFQYFIYQFGAQVNPSFASIFKSQIINKSFFLNKLVELFFIITHIIIEQSKLMALPPFLLFTLITAIAASQQPTQAADSFLKQLSNALAQYNTSYLQQLKHGVSKQNKKDYAEAFNSEIYRLKSILSEVIVQEVQISPFLKWAQNKTHLFLTIKNSHRWDSPPCINVRHLNFKINQKNVSYESHCLVSHSNITFKLDLQLNQDIDLQDCQRNAESSQSCLLELSKANDGVGVYSVVLKKSEAQIWPFLGKQEKHYPIWQALSEKYQQDYKTYLAKLQVLEKARRKSFETILSCAAIFFALFLGM